MHHKRSSPNDAYKVIADLLQKNRELEILRNPLSKQEVKRFLTDAKRMNLISATLENLEMFYTYLDLLSRFVPLREILTEVIKAEKSPLRKIVILAAFDYKELCSYLEMERLIESAMRSANETPWRMGALVRAFD